MPTGRRFSAPSAVRSVGIRELITSTQKADRCSTMVCLHRGIHERNLFSDCPGVRTRIFITAFLEPGAAGARSGGVACRQSPYTDGHRRSCAALFVAIARPRTGRAADRLPDRRGGQRRCALGGQSRRVDQRPHRWRAIHQHQLSRPGAGSRQTLFLAGKGVGCRGQSLSRSRNQLVGDRPADPGSLERPVDRLRDARGKRGPPCKSTMDREPRVQGPGRGEVSGAALRVSRHGHAFQAGAQRDALRHLPGHGLGLGERRAGAAGRPAASLQADALEEIRERQRGQATRATARMPSPSIAFTTS